MPDFEMSRNLLRQLSPQQILELFQNAARGLPSPANAVVPPGWPQNSPTMPAHIWDPSGTVNEMQATPKGLTNPMVTPQSQVGTRAGLPPAPGTARMMAQRPQPATTIPATPAALSRGAGGVGGLAESAGAGMTGATEAAASTAPSMLARGAGMLKGLGKGLAGGAASLGYGALKANIPGGDFLPEADPVSQMFTTALRGAGIMEDPAQAMAAKIRQARMGKMAAAPLDVAPDSTKFSGSAATPGLPPQGGPASPAGQSASQMQTVQKGDTLTGMLAAIMGLPPTHPAVIRAAIQIAAGNGIQNANVIQPGQQIDFNKRAATNAPLPAFGRKGAPAGMGASLAGGMGAPDPRFLRSRKEAEFKGLTMPGQPSMGQAPAGLGRGMGTPARMPLDLKSLFMEGQMEEPNSPPFAKLPTLR